MAEHKIDDITELMTRSGLSRNSINKLYRENNMETTKLETLMRLCDTFGCKLSDLIEYRP
jgi:putative transcriptional regulator